MDQRIGELAQALREQVSDGFADQVLDGAMLVLADRTNPIRLNLFSAAVRELFGHVLHVSAPDDQIRQCEWYENDQNRPTRRQRAIFAMQGGMSDSLVKQLGVDADEAHRECISVIDKLNKFTHVRPNSLVQDEAEITRFAADALIAFLELLETFQDCRDHVIAAILDAIDHATFETFMEQTIDELDVLSSHTLVEHPWIDEIKIRSIDAHHIHYEIIGSVEVTMNYGSGSDFRRGDGVSIDDSFPYSIQMKAGVKKLDDFEDITCQVNTDSFFE